VKIQDIDTILIDSPGRKWTIVRVFTDAGLVGLGEATYSNKEPVVVAAIEHLKQGLIGEDPGRIEYLWHKLYWISSQSGIWRMAGPVWMSAMAGISAGNFKALAEKFDFSRYETLCDVGGATGQLACMVAAANPHMRCTSADLPKVEPIAKRCIERAGLSDRVSTAVVDFFEDPLPKADVITMGMILHDWNLEKKMHLIKLAYDALPPGGAFVVVEALIDDARRENAFGLWMSLNMLIEFGDAFDYSGADFRDWCSEVGFDRFDVIPLAGPSSAAVAYKPG